MILVSPQTRTEIIQFLSLIKYVCVCSYQFLVMARSVCLNSGMCVYLVGERQLRGEADHHSVRKAKYGTMDDLFSYIRHQTGATAHESIIIGSVQLEINLTNLTC